MRRRRITVGIVTAGLAVSAILAGTGSAAAAGSPPGSAAQSTTTPKAHDPIAANGRPAVGRKGRAAAAAEWGVTNGKPWYKILKGTQVGKYTPNPPALRPTALPAVTTYCHEQVDNISLSGRTFYWDTWQECFGNYGLQDMRTQMWRSSWSGWRGYGAWTPDTPSPPTSASYIFDNWTLGCGSGGKYDYTAAMSGWASQIGRGPNIRAANTLRQYYCGTSPA
ncbi:MAG: hypothetical protein ACR2MP_12240 [Streptosporangiaceae bacterium]